MIKKDCMLTTHGSHSEVRTVLMTKELSSEIPICFFLSSVTKEIATPQSTIAKQITKEGYATVVSTAKSPLRVSSIHKDMRYAKIQEQTNKLTITIHMCLQVLAYLLANIRKPNAAKKYTQILGMTYPPRSPAMQVQTVRL